jgi:hypothetical protein
MSSVSGMARVAPPSGMVGNFAITRDAKGPRTAQKT